MDTWACHSTPGLVAQKKTLKASERDEWARAAFRVRVASQAAADFVVIDETGLNLDLTPRYSRAPRGMRALETVPRNTPLNTTLIGSCSVTGMGPSLLLKGGVDSAAFEAYLCEVLGPSLRPGQIVLLDNLSVHRCVRVAEMVEARGCTVWYLPTVLAGAVADRVGVCQIQGPGATGACTDAGGT